MDFRAKNRSFLVKYITLFILLLNISFQVIDARPSIKPSSKNSLSKNQFLDYYDEDTDDSSPVSEEDNDNNDENEISKDLPQIDIKISTDSDEESEIKITKENKHKTSNNESKQKLIEIESELLNKITELQKYFSQFKSSDKSIMQGPQGFMKCEDGKMWNSVIGRCVFVSTTSGHSSHKKRHHRERGRERS